MENISGFQLLQQELENMERQGIAGLPSLNHFLESKHLYVTKEDIRALREILKKRKYKLIRVTDYAIVKRGKKK
jgi:hypothetical protein